MEIILIILILGVVLKAFVSGFALFWYILTLPFQIIGWIFSGPIIPDMNSKKSRNTCDKEIEELEEDLMYEYEMYDIMDCDIEDL